MSFLSKEPGLQRKTRLSDQVAERIQHMILSKQLKPGNRLPAERELSEVFGVSRTVIREAVRALTARGMLEVKTGSGTLVSQLTTQMISDTMTLMFQLNQQTTLENVREIRQLLEVEVAGLAAQRREQSDLDTAGAILRRAEANLSDLAVFVETDIAFHIALATATQNILFSIMLDSVNGILTNVRRLAARVHQTPSRALRHHLAILEQIRLQNSDGAREAMRSHLEEGRGTQLEAIARDQNP